MASFNFNDFFKFLDDEKDKKPPVTKTAPSVQQNTNSYTRPAIETVKTQNPTVFNPQNAITTNDLDTSLKNFQTSFGNFVTGQNVKSAPQDLARIEYSLREKQTTGAPITYQDTKDLATAQRNNQWNNVVNTANDLVMAVNPIEPLLTIPDTFMRTQALNAQERQTNPIQTQSQLFGNGVTPSGFVDNLVTQNTTGLIVPGAENWSTQQNPTVAAMQQESAQANERLVNSTDNAIGQLAIQAGISGADLLTRAALTGGSSAAFLGLTGVDSGVNYANTALNEGYTVDEATLRGLAGGALTAGIESVAGIGGKAVGNFLGGTIGKTLSSTLPKSVTDYVSKFAASKAGQVITNGLAEGSEEVAEYYSQALLDKIILDKDTPTDIKEALNNFAVGALVGGGFGAVNSFNSPIQKTENTSDTALQATAQVNAQLNNVTQALQKGALTGQQAAVIANNYIQSAPKEAQEALVQDGSPLNSLQTAIQEMQAQSTALANNQITQQQALQNTIKAFADAAPLIAQTNTISNIAQNNNLNVEFAPLADNINGMFINGKVVINEKNANPLTVFAHELTHSIEKTGEYAEFSSLVKNYMGEAFNAKLSEISAGYASQGVNLKPIEVEQEVIANFVETSGMFNDQNFINRIANEKPSIAQKIYNWISDTIKRLTGSADVQFLTQAKQMYEQALNSAKTNRNVSGNVQFSVNPNFEQEYNNWDKKSRAGEFYLGHLSAPFQNIKGQGADITIDKSKIIDIKNKHAEMTDNIIKQIPQILENPTIIMQSKTVNGRIVAFGEVFSALNKPILVAMELNPSGNIDNLVKVVSAYGRNGNVKEFIENSTILFENKNKIDSWNKRLGLQLPVLSSTTNLDSQSIPQNTIDVNSQVAQDIKAKFSLNTDSNGKELSQAQQEFFKDSKVRDEKGRLKVVYHGTPNSFTEFSYDFIGANGTALGKGFYFVDNKNFAAGYATNKNGIIMENYLNIQKPLSETTKTITKKDFSKYVKALHKAKEKREEYTGVLWDYGDLSSQSLDRVLNEAVNLEYDNNDNDVELIHSIGNANGQDWLNDFKILKKTLGYDGVIHAQENETIYVPFLPNQIKNIDNQNPTASADIRYSIEYEGKKYSKYKAQEGKITDTDVQQLAEPYIEYRKTTKNRGRLTKEQWLSSFEAMGKELANRGKKEADIEQAMYELWFKYHPNQKESLNRQGKGFVKFTINDAFEAMERGANQVPEYSNVLPDDVNDDVNNYDNLDIPFGLSYYNGEMVDFYGFMQNNPNMELPQAIEAFESLPAQAPVEASTVEKIEKADNFKAPENTRKFAESAVNSTLDSETKGTIKEQIQNEETEPTTAKVLTTSEQSTPTFNEKKIKTYDQLQSAKRWFQRKFTDSGIEIDRMGKITKNPYLYYAYNNAKQSRQSAEYMIAERQANFKGEDVGKGLVEVFEPIRNKGEEYTAAFYTYLLHMHNIDRMAQEKPVFGESVTADVSQQTANDLLTANPEFEQLANDVYAYNKNLMQYRVDSGLISKQQADTMNTMYPHYVPTFRNITGTAGSSASKGNASVSSTVKKAKGGNSDILPLHESMARQTMQTVQAARRNELGQMLLKESKKHDLSEFIQNAQQTKDAFDIDEDLSKTNLTENTFSFYDNGKKTTLNINKDLYEGIKAISATESDYNVLLKSVQNVNNTFKKLVTSLNPGFMLRNPIRDFQDVSIFSQDPVLFAKKLKTATIAIKNNSKLWKQYKALGGFGSSVFDYETGYDSKAFNSTAKTKNPLKAGYNIVQKAGSKIEDANFVVEQLPRFTEFLVALEKNGDYSRKGMLKAQYSAADITTNFGRSGTITKFLNSSLVPFMNPSIQGASKIWRTYTGKKTLAQWGILAARTAAFGMLPSFLNELLYEDEEEYQKLHDRDKDNNYLFHLGGDQWLKIPKGRLISVIGGAVQRSWRALKGQDNAFNGFFSNAIGNIGPVNPLTSNIFAPVLAVNNNTTWYGTPIEPQRLEDLPAGERYDENTSIIAKQLGKALNYSPKKIDYLIDAYSGVIGDFALPLMTPTSEQNPLKKQFVIDSTFSNKIPTTFYDTLEKITQKSNSSKTSDEDKSVYENMIRYMSKQNKLVSELNAEERAMQLTNISDKEKGERSKEIKTLTDSIQQNVLNNLDAYEKTLRETNTGDKDLDYFLTNGEMFGADYAVKTYNSASYEKAVERGENMEDYFDEIADRLSSKIIEEETTPIAEQAATTQNEQAPIIQDAAGLDTSSLRQSTIDKAHSYDITAQDWKYVSDRIDAYDTTEKPQVLKDYGFEGESYYGLMEEFVLSDTAQNKLTVATENGIEKGTYIDGYAFGLETQGTKAERNAQISEYVNDLDLTSGQKEMLYEFLEVYKGTTSSSSSSSGSSGGSSSGGSGSSSASSSMSLEGFFDFLAKAPKLESATNLNYGQSITPKTSSSTTTQTTTQPENKALQMLIAAAKK